MTVPKGTLLKSIKYIQSIIYYKCKILLVACVENLNIFNLFAIKQNDYATVKKSIKLQGHQR